MIPRAARRAIAAAIVWGLLPLLAGQAAVAQALPSDALDALRTGQRLASEALLTYPQHFPDQPLWLAALDAGRTAAAAAPEHPAPQRFLATAYGQVGWYARAWTHWQAYLEFGGALDAQASQHLLEAANWLGIRAFDEGWEQAEAYLRTVVQLDPDNLGAHERLARLALARGAPDEARPHLERLDETLVADLVELRERAELQSRHGAAAAEAFLAGRSALAAGDAMTAFERFGDAAAADDAFVAAWRARASTGLRLGRPADAVAAWEQVLRLAPGDAEAAAGLARARDQLAFGVEAQRAFDRGLAAYRAGDVAGARVQFLAAVSQNPGYVDALAWLGRIAAEAGDLTSAAARYRSALALAPARADLTQALAQLEARQAAAVAAAEAATAPTAPAPAPAPTPAPPPQPPPEPPAPEPSPQPEPTPEPQPEPGTAPATGPAPTPEPEPAPQPVAPAETVPAEPTPEPAMEPSDAGRTASWIVIVDTAIEHRAASVGGTGAFTFLGTHQLDRDLDAFDGGTLHVRLDVRSKPSDDPVHYQLCLVQEDIAVLPACTPSGALAFGTPGNVTLALPLNALSRAGAVDWSDGVAQLMLVLRQPDGTPIDDRLLPGQTSRTLVDPSRYYPMEVRVTAVLVAPGGAPPVWR